MSGTQDENPPPPPPQQTQQAPTQQQTPHTVSTIKLAYSQKGVNNILRSMKQEHYMAHTGLSKLYASSSNLPNVAFVSENTSSTNDVSTAYGVSNTSGHNSKNEQTSTSTSSYSLLASHSSCPQLDHEDLDQVESKEDNRRRDGWNTGNRDGSRTGKKEESKALVTVDGESIDWTTHSKDDEDYALMASNSSGSDIQVLSCSNECKESYANLKRLYDAQREQLSDASVEIKAYTQGLKKVEAQLVAHQQGQLWYEQKIKFMKIDLDDKTDVLTYHKTLLAKAQKEKDDLEAIVDKWNHSSKNLGKIINYQMTASDKFGLGYGDYRYSGNLSYENEMSQSVFKCKDSDFENLPLYKRLAKTSEMQAVPPPMTGNYMPSGPDIEIDDSQYTYGPEKTQPSESESQTTELDTCVSNISTETSELVCEPVVNESKIEVKPKVWSDAPIIEEYESDSDDEYVSVKIEGLDTPSFATKQVKTPRENVKNKSTHTQKPKVNNKELGDGFTERACFVCGSFSHLIRDCDYHVKLAKQVELHKQNMSKGNGTRERTNKILRKPTWNNVQRVNKQNQFVPLAVQTRTGNNPVNTAKASSTNNFSTARQNVNRQTVLTSTALKVNTVKPIVNGVRPANVFHKTHSPSSRPFKRTTVLRTNFSNQKVYTAKVKEVSTVGGKWDTADNPHRTLKNKGIIDSGCSRHMTGNKAYLADYQDINGGPVAFGGSKGYITGKGKIKTGKLDFEDVSFVKELQPFNLFSVSQMCDKKNKVLFTDSECLVLSPDFKLPDENQILLKVPRQNNMYSFNLENIVPLGGLACLIAKATTDESNLWHRRLGHVNFKNLNRLVKGNLVRGLPTKLFQNDHTCVACQKGKQHKASCKAKVVSSISQTLQLLHMDLFGPTSVRSINHKTYCLVITDDFSRFSWTFFLRTKDETSAILKDFIRQIENQLNQKVKTIRCDNGTEFKNRDIIEFCGLKGIKREYSNARTPQQNGVAERKNRTLIEAARTMLADSFLPNTFWAEAVSTACYEAQMIDTWKRLKGNVEFHDTGLLVLQAGNRYEQEEGATEYACVNNVWYYSCYWAMNDILLECVSTANVIREDFSTAFFVREIVKAVSIVRHWLTHGFLFSVGYEEIGQNIEFHKCVFLSYLLALEITCSCFHGFIDKDLINLVLPDVRRYVEVLTEKVQYQDLVLWIRPDLEVRLEDGVSYPKMRVLDMFYDCYSRLGVEDVMVIAAKHVIVAGLKSRVLDLSCGCMVIQQVVCVWFMDRKEERLGYGMRELWKKV
ncbi:putative ribonuclease H-like domain-containing protein [Tanacetum coccineum]|uniref:Ribonuclease H-like domain-containing protein n=1 Tax=Tanacetum coccineum TaxID=301880 RepID=A0ABQ4YAP7_9ASTR